MDLTCRAEPSLHYSDSLKHTPRNLLSFLSFVTLSVCPRHASVDSLGAEWQ